jgi:hypothetical protein
MLTYSPPDHQLLHYLYKTIWACQYQGAKGLCVVNIKAIHSVIAVMPLPCEAFFFFVTEKLGLDVAILGSVEEEPE